MKKLFIIPTLAVLGLSAYLSIGTVNAQTAYITNATSHDVSVVNIATNAVAATIPVGNSPQGVSVNSDGSKVYIANGSFTGTVSVINAATNTVTTTIPVGHYPSGISVSPDGSKVFVANMYNPGTVSVIDAATNAVITSITVGANPGGICVSPDGNKVYVANNYDSPGTVSVIDVASYTVSASIIVGTRPWGISLSPDGSKLYVCNASDNNVSVVNTSTNTVSTTITVGSGPYGICVSPDGSKVYVTNHNNNGSGNSVSVINSAVDTVSATIAVGATPWGISVSPDGSKIFVPLGSATNTVSVINTATNTVMTSITVGSYPAAFGNFISSYIQLAANTTHTNVSCNGGSNGTATAYATGATTPYTYSWSTTPTQTGQMATGLAIGNYTVTVTGANGATKTAGVTITQPAEITANNPQTICNSGSYIINGHTYSVAGTYHDTLIAIHGCDSIVTTNLTVNPVYAFTENHSICNGETYNWHGVDYTTANTYTANYTSIHGCDSIYTLHLTVNPVYAFTENHSICNGDIYNWHGTDYSTANTYTANYTSIHGCDSIYTLHLTVNPVYAFSENQSICNGETYNWHGVDYTTANTYTANYTSINGCDSVYTLNLTVNSVDTSLSVSDPVITANASGATYQWLDCNNALAPIAGETSQSYTATANGNYAVAITQGACTDTSSCVQILSIGISSIQWEGIFIYPNPATNNITIESPQLAVIEITNIQGQLIKTLAANSHKTSIDISAYSSGVYFVKVKTEKGIMVKKFVKE
jgi:YVTN family beta-propeller protein